MPVRSTGRRLFITASKASSYGIPSTSQYRISCPTFHWSAGLFIWQRAFSALQSTSSAIIAEVIPAGLKIPHIGWNALEIARPHPIFRDVKPGDCVYFVHSYHGARCGAAVVATAEYGAPLTAAVARGNVVGCQFHPEKSGEVGLRILKAFCELESNVC